MSEQRAVPFYCPFCGDEDLYPTETLSREGTDDSKARLGGVPGKRGDEDAHGAWHCRSCTRVFSLKLVGLVTS